MSSQCKPLRFYCSNDTINQLVHKSLSFSLWNPKLSTSPFFSPNIFISTLFLNSCFVFSQSKWSFNIHPKQLINYCVVCLDLHYFFKVHRMITVFELNNNDDFQNLLLSYFIIDLISICQYCSQNIIMKIFYNYIVTLSLI